MQLPRLFKTYKHRQFTYKPIFYNPAKEELAYRIKKAEGELREDNYEGYKIAITRGSIKQFSKRRNRTLIRINFRLALITLILLGLAWYLLH